MDGQTFREFGKAAMDFLVNYMENIRDCDVLPSVTPGYLVESLPTEIPETSQPWQEILKDVETLIKPGMTHWQSPNMHAFYPTGCTYECVVGEMLSAGFSVIGFNWVLTKIYTHRFYNCLL